jgi:hypothetical protein
LVRTGRSILLMRDFMPRRSIMVFRELHPKQREQ